MTLVQVCIADEGDSVILLANGSLKIMPENEEFIKNLHKLLNTSESTAVAREQSKPVSSKHNE